MNIKTVATAIALTLATAGAAQAQYGGYGGTPDADLYLRQTQQWDMEMRQFDMQQQLDRQQEQQRQLERQQFEQQKWQDQQNWENRYIYNRR
jgi:hypothetical protein